MAEVAFVLPTVPRCGAGDGVAVRFGVPSQLLVGDGAVAVGPVDDLVNLLAVEVGSFGAAGGLKVVGYPGGSCVWFLAEGA